MDLVYIVRQFPFNVDLQYSLRSVDALVTGFDRIFISGYKPKFVRGVYFIPTEQKDTKWRNALNNVIAACRDPRVSSDFILMNDDFIAVNPVDVRTDLALNRGSLTENAKRFSRMDRPTTWQKGIVSVCTLLKSLKVNYPKDYSLHLPMIINKQHFLEMMELPEVKTFLASGEMLSFRNLYGNLYTKGKTKKIADVKLPKGKDLTPDRLEGQWISVFDGVTKSPRFPLLNAFLDKFPKSKYEH